MARSLAFWIEDNKVETTSHEDKEEKTKTEVELHFNFWHLEGLESPYLDIGIRFTSITDFKSVNVYLPFDTGSQSYIPDLGTVVCSDDDLLSAVFNSPNVMKEKNPQRGYFDISLTEKGKKEKLRFYTHIREDFDSPAVGVTRKTVNNESGETIGTHIKFPRSTFDPLPTDGSDAYLRFRINVSERDLQSISTRYSPKGFWLNNDFEEGEIVDFRVNESRNLPHKIRGFLADDSSIKKVHFFLIRDSKSEYKMSHSAYERCRLLEADLWSTYLEPSKLKGIDKHMLIYHWKGKPDNGDAHIDHFAAFAKFTQKSIATKKLVFAGLIILVLGVISGLLANLIWSSAGWGVQSAPQVLCSICSQESNTKSNKSFPVNSIATGVVPVKKLNNGGEQND